MKQPRLNEELGWMSAKHLLTVFCLWLQRSVALIIRLGTASSRGRTAAELCVKSHLKCQVTHVTACYSRGEPADGFQPPKIQSPISSLPLLAWEEKIKVFSVYHQWIAICSLEVAVRQNIKKSRNQTLI